jgi:PadR family transcriptional regulator AphA
VPARPKTRFAILGLLNWKPLSGYDIKRLVEAGLSHFWSESYGHLFPTLEGLVREGLAVRKDARRHGRRSRHVYSITRKGRAALDRWLEEPSDFPSARNEFILKLFLCSHEPPERGARLLEEYRETLHERLTHYRESEAVLARAARDGETPGEVREILEDGPGDPLPLEARRFRNRVFLATLRHGIATIEARIDWCREALRALEERAGSRTTGDPPPRGRHTDRKDTR